MNVLSTAPVIAVDQEKCVNCHACISACPVKFCNDGSGDYVTVNHELCIGCGSCIKACTHAARSGIDDFDKFIAACEAGEPLTAIVAPAAASNFPGRYLELNGWLQSLGVEAFFDVSFGAELTVKSYLEYAAEANPATIIAQPCPAIVTYIETYQPELLPYLAPADSPMLHTIKLIKEYYQEFSGHRIAVISPCYAKRREFDETGLGDYNITYQSIQNYLQAQETKLEDYPPLPFYNAPAERAVLFSTPGGLMETVQRDAEEVSRRTRKIEGPDIIYPYLDSLEENVHCGRAPLLVDCLNCELGCNGGPGTLNVGKSPDEIEYAVEERQREARRRYRKGRSGSVPKLQRLLKKYWKKGLYERSYTDRSSMNTIQIPDEAELTAIYHRLHKYTEKDHLNCGACGYGCCESMAVAIFNGLNKAENCFHYERTSRKEMAQDLSEQLRASINHIRHFVISLAEAEEANEAAPGKSGMARIYQLSKDNNDIVTNGVGYIEQTLRKMEEIQESSGDTAGGIKALGEGIEGIWEIVGIINSIAAQTKIIAFNAELEASSAGEKGKNFEIVASEIRRLADNTVASTEEIKKSIREIHESSNHLILAGQEEGEKISQGMELSAQLKEVFNRLQGHSELSFGSINEIIKEQVANFESLLEELNALNRKVDHFDQ